jgi:16S rRNA U1498 N3-methylase RsmE
MGIEVLDFSPHESHYLCNVMRARDGAEVIVLNGKGLYAHGTLITADRKCARIKIEKMTKFEYLSHSIILLQAVLKTITMIILCVRQWR